LALRVIIKEVKSTIKLQVATSKIGENFVNYYSNVNCCHSVH